MREIEILAACENPKSEALSVLSGSCEKVGEKHTVDKYLILENRASMHPTHQYSLLECLRLRSQSGKSYITYKYNHFDPKGIWIYSDEHEYGIDDMKQAELMFSRLGFVELVTVDNNRTVFYSGDFEIAIDDVDGLGIFLEVERKNVPDEADALVVKQGIRDFISGLGLRIGPELNYGKPELLLMKKDGKNASDFVTSE